MDQDNIPTEVVTEKSPGAANGVRKSFCSLVASHQFVVPIY